MEIMKKFMILMLSLAVLFSFAACDNSNTNTPVDPEEPAGGETITYDGITKALAEVADIEDGSAKGIEAVIKGLLGVTTSNTDIISTNKDNEKVTVTVSAADYTTLTIEKELAEAVGTTLPAKTVKLEISGVKTSPSNADGSTTPYTVALEKFALTYDTYTTAINNNVSDISYTVNGWLVGATASIKVDAAKGEVTEYKLTPDNTLTIVLPETAAEMTLLVDEEKATESVVFDLVNQGMSANTYKAYRNDVVGDVEDEVDAYVTTLIGANASGTALASKFNFAALASATGIESATYSPENGGSATIIFKATANTEIAKDATNTITLPMNGTVTLVLAGNPEDTTSKEASFTAKTFTITSSVALEVAGGAGDFDEITVTGLSGEVSGGSVVRDTNNSSYVGSVSSLAFGAFTTVDGGTVTTSETVPVGPELIRSTTTTNGTLAVEAVTVNYAD